MSATELKLKVMTQAQVDEALTEAKKEAFFAGLTGALASFSGVLSGHSVQLPSHNCAARMRERLRPKRRPHVIDSPGRER
ncbi:hypothetical protein CC1G_12074 [Coprinopsis cinerea okayama7|uniref:Uncharacterized protein n=1 Tax=Coprinopsis cinerea (strain Okayama-7 / 130 / ATCC MYA-4618 / FGSC 9003) TaxID=240176 RepID=A8N0E3_COPC7|nr:hypothetical protein CC1G_12074 [Coprinopsis cinerea okayama7\|eukprot:XP_001828344.2 hypothetical protein CC1G_12074 [Coprinopsis cinerea okayama7\